MSADHSPYDDYYEFAKLLQKDIETTRAELQAFCEEFIDCEDWIEAIHRRTAEYEFELDMATGERLAELKNKLPRLRRELLIASKRKSVLSKAIDTYTSIILDYEEMLQRVIS